MRKRQKHVSEEENLDTHQSSSTSLDISEVIPIDLFLDIFSRLPHKTIAKCLCVSKLWSSIISRPDFNDSIFKRSSAHQCLLFTFNSSYSSVKDLRYFFSSPQPVKPDENLPLLAVDDGIRVPSRTGLFHMNAPVHGLLCSNVLVQKSGCSDFELEVMVCNPSTGESMTLPKVKTNSHSVKTYLGYDPINRQSKVLCMSLYRNPCKCQEHQVLTLRTEELSWRKIECSLPDHTPISDQGVSINGVLYYIARQNKRKPLPTFTLPYIIVCFDVMSEKFTYNALDKNVTSCSVLTNYGGKLCVIRKDSNGFFSGTTKNLELWVLDGVKQHRWLKMNYILPSWNKLVAFHTMLNIVGMTSNGEVVFSPMVLSDPFYIFFYNVKTDTIKRVEIQGIGPVRGQPIHTFINHIEDMRWLRYNIAK